MSDLAPELAAPVKDIERRAFRGGAVTLAAQGGRVVLQVGSTACLARLLSPRDFGLFGMVAMVTGLVQLINDLGLNAATIQRRQLTERQISAMFWVNLAASTCFTLLTAATAPLVAHIYREPSLTWILTALSSTLLLSGASAQHWALLSRQMRFTALSTVDLVAMAAGIAAAIVAAFLGAGVWALVVQQLSSATTRSLMLFASVRWLPSRPSFGPEERAMLRFGGHVSVFRIVNFFSRNLDNALIGWYWDAATLGIYSRAYALFMAPMSNLIPAVRRVMETSMSRVQEDMTRFTAMYKRAEETIAWLVMPLAILTTVAADPIVKLLLGERWGAVVPILRILSIASVVQPILNSTGWLFTSTGRGDKLMRWGMLSSAAHCIAFVIAVRFGNFGMACAAAGVRVLLAPIGLRMGIAIMPLTLGGLVWELRWPLLATSCGAALGTLALSALAAAHPVVQVLAAAICMYSCVVAALFLSGRLRTLREMLLRRDAVS